MKLRNRKELRSISPAKRVRIVKQTGKARTLNVRRDGGCNNISHKGWRVARRRGNMVRYQCTGCLTMDGWEMDPDLMGPPPAELAVGKASALIIDEVEMVPGSGGDMAVEWDSKGVATIETTGETGLVGHDVLGLDDNEDEEIRRHLRLLGRDGMAKRPYNELRGLAREAGVKLKAAITKGSVIDRLCEWAGIE